MGSYARAASGLQSCTIYHYETSVNFFKIVIMQRLGHNKNRQNDYPTEIGRIVMSAHCSCFGVEIKRRLRAMVRVYKSRRGKEKRLFRPFRAEESGERESGEREPPSIINGGDGDRVHYGRSVAGPASLD